MYGHVYIIYTAENIQLIVITSASSALFDRPLKIGSTLTWLGG